LLCTWKAVERYKARNQLGTPGGAKSFPKWTQIF